ncbi:hypothetical protein [Pantoea ananatis]|uniref:hypothetical protein n=1 Tax=Pantoea ananas TaxID=553 RepID=UPI003CEEE8EF
MNKDNPASRLYEILKAAKSKSVLATQREVWKKSLNMEDCTDSQLYAQLGKVMALPEEINIWLLETFPTKSWVTWRSSVEAAFSNINLNGKWEMSASHLNDRALTELDLISILFETNGGLEAISDEELSAFAAQIFEIKKELLHSKLPTEMQKTFLKYLNKILDALESYHITGAIPIMEAVESAMGHVIIDSDYADSLKQTGTGEKLITFLCSIVDAVISVQGLPPVATPFHQLMKPKSDLET